MEKKIKNATKIVQLVIILLLLTASAYFWVIENDRWSMGLIILAGGTYLLSTLSED